MDIKHKETNNFLIDESSSIGKIFSHITNKTCFGTITAFSDKYTLQQNLKRNTKLESDIYYLRFGFNKFRGYFIENNGQAPAVEEVLIVYSKPDRQKELNDFLKSACRYYDQDAILLAAGGEASLWHKDGTEDNLGSFHIDPAELRQAYSAIKGKPFRFGDPRCAGQDESSSLNECLAECVPIKTKSHSMSDYVSYRAARRRLIEDGERYLECREEETRRIRGFHEKIFEEESKRPKHYQY